MKRDDPLTRFRPNETPQQEQARPDQVKNNAGGYTFKVDKWTKALRFLILGTSGGTYYVSEQALTRENANDIVNLAGTDGEKLVELIVDVSESGRAPKQNPTLFALAACTASSDQATRQAAYKAIKRVCRTGTHLFIFTGYVEQFRGWSRGLRSAISSWYVDKPVDRVAYQTVKYRQREGWSHRDLLRLAHPETDDPERKALFDWVVGRDNENVPEIVTGFKKVQSVTTPKDWSKLVKQYSLPWEALPDVAMNSVQVWDELLPNTGMTALVRQLGRLTKIGVIKPLSERTTYIANRLTDPGEVKASRIHPLTVLTALVTYDKGHGLRGKLSWIPVPKILEALNEMFYLAFGNIEPANKRTLLGLDVSGSMTWGSVANSPLVPFQAEAALAMAWLRTEPEVYPMAFSSRFQALDLTKSDSLGSVLQKISNLSFGSTDCALPMVWAKKNNVTVDSFIISTDNDTWSGDVHPFQALRDYRQKMGIPARLAVIGITATDFTIADPSDSGMLDVVGLDTASPNLINAFSRGDV